MMISKRAHTDSQDNPGSLGTGIQSAGLSLRTSTRYYLVVYGMYTVNVCGIRHFVAAAVHFTPSP